MPRRVLFSLGVLVLSSVSVQGQTASKTPAGAAARVAEEVIAATRAQWVGEKTKDAAAWGRNVAEDYTVFEGAYPTRVDGKATMQRIVEGGAGSSDTLVTAEMVNEKVQVYGDVAILTYNYIGAIKNKDGHISPTLAKSTRVYVKQGGQWMLVHANFAPITAPK
jgi:ketosteroid isomerase-like protein